MKKRFISICLLLLLVFGFQASTYASEYEILNPEKDTFSTRNKVVLVNGKAPTDTKIVMDIYGTTDLTRKNFNLANLPKDEDYIKRLTEEVKAGNMGFFKKEIELILGVNKIVVKFDRTDIAEEIVIYVYDQSILPNENTLINFTKK